MAVNASRGTPLDGVHFGLRSVAFGAEQADATEPGVPFTYAPEFWPDAVTPRTFAVDWEIDDVVTDGGSVVLSILIGESADMDAATTILTRTVSEAGVARDYFDIATLAQLYGVTFTGSRWISCAVSFSGGGGAERCNYGATVRAV